MADLTGNVSAIANVLYPYGVILGFVGTVFTVVFALVKFRSLIFKLFAGLRNTSKRETQRTGGVIVRLFRSLDESKQESRSAAAESKAAKEEAQRVTDALVIMTDALVEERRVTEKLQASRDAEAKQKDEMLARYALTFARYDQARVLERLDVLDPENALHLPPDLPEGEGLITITGKHRLPTTTVQTVPQGVEARS